MILTDQLRAQYQQLYDSMIISPTKENIIENFDARISANINRYKSVASQCGTLPWYVVGIIHAMECSLNFGCHMHNGDPLSARTIHVPRGRPLTGTPPFRWEQSAVDAMTMRGFAVMTDWSVPAILFDFESYNGFGYRAKGINTPYLWSFTNNYITGKFTVDHGFDPAVVSGQCGAAPLLQKLISE